jgi:hypothetical protein
MEYVQDWNKGSSLETNDISSLSRETEWKTLVQV